jgi:large subunit ribosomal protein L29
MKSKELQNLSIEDLSQKEKTLKKELFELQFHRKVGTVEKPARFKEIKRSIARILTVIKERDLKNERTTKKR